MPVIPLLCIDNRFFVVLPESLYTFRTLVFISHIIAERSLDSSRHVMPVAVPHSFQREELATGSRCTYYSRMNFAHSFWILDEGFGDAHLPFRLRNPGVGKNSLASATRVTGPCIFSCV
jgi:hypothetical protein